MSRERRVWLQEDQPADTLAFLRAYASLPAGTWIRIADDGIEIIDPPARQARKDKENG